MIQCIKDPKLIEMKQSRIIFLHIVANQHQLSYSLFFGGFIRKTNIFFTSHEKKYSFYISKITFSLKKFQV